MFEHIAAKPQEASMLLAPQRGTYPDAEERGVTPLESDAGRRWAASQR